MPLPQDETQNEQTTIAPAAEPSATPAAPAIEAPAEPALSATEKAVNELFGDAPADEDETAAAEDAPAAAKPEAEKPPEKAADAPAEPKVDDDLTPPEGMKEASKERWGKLTERVKTAETQYQETSQKLTAVQELVGKSTLTADEFTNVLELGRLTKSSNPEDRKRAVAQLQELLADVSGSIGMEVKGFDPLDKHPDLKQALENMEISKERALELAQLRAMKAQTQQSQQVTQEQQQTHQAVQQASAQSEAWLKSMAGTPGHEAKAKFVADKLQEPAFQQQLIQQFHPNQWLLIVQNLYAAYTPPAPAAPPAIQPLRSSIGAVSRSNAPPKDMHEAVENAVNQLFGSA